MSLLDYLLADNKALYKAGYRYRGSTDNQDGGYVEHYGSTKKPLTVAEFVDKVILPSIKKNKEHWVLIRQSDSPVGFPVRDIQERLKRWGCKVSRDGRCLYYTLSQDGSNLYTPHIGDVKKAFSQYRLDAKVVTVGYNKFIDPFYPYKPTWIYGWVLATEDYPFNNVEVEL